MELYTSIEKKDSLSYKDFVEQYARPGIPVVLKNASAAWQSNKIFTPEFLEKTLVSIKHQQEKKNIPCRKF